ncbi:carbohydrate-binding domain-containing protein [Prevotella sp. E13-17]|uniref:carbohydrate-binding domain-containing protein n=1 Tax=Prevotella sp. E13-17 TaxID=2913616 RepID=UPI001EDA5538|nr:carbohydrate-binding domain-containing protein [Prevotella sp. E13-17]UKK50999.1 carbohydrate-binding domain-containing protein [Prevotella sp. E13-17]
MRKILLYMAAILLWTTTEAQTLNVQLGEVVYQIPASQAGDMVYENGQTVTIMGKTLALSDISQMYIDNSVVTDNSVSIDYQGETARVTVAGNIAKHLTISTNKAHVSLIQSATLTDEITYTLSGTSTNGSFYMDGELKASVVLNGVTLTNPDSAAINIRNGKRISIELAEGTTSTLVDGVGGSQKACFAVKGHTEFKGAGTLNITGRTAHAFWGKEYVQLKKSTGTINILGAVGDGFNVNQYFQMNGGTVNINNVSDDGLQLSYKTDDDDQIIPLTDDEDNTGEVIINAGTLKISTTAAGAKCIKSENKVTVHDGTLTLKGSGGIDTSDSSDPSYTAGVKAEDFTQNGGTVEMTISGAAGRGVSADHITTNGGLLTINNSGAPQTVSSDVKSAKGLKGEYIALNAGIITIAMTGNAGKGIAAGNGTKSTSGGGGWFAPARAPMMAPARAPMMAPGGRPGGGGMGGGTTYTNVTGAYTQGTADGNGPTLTVSTTGSAYSSSSAKAIKAICAAVIYGGETTVTTKTNGAEGLESKTGITINGGKHYLQCYDDCINTSGKIVFNGGITVCYSNGNDAVDSNAGTTGAITIGNGTCFAYTSAGGPEEGFDCDNNSYIQITGNGTCIGAGGAQGGGSSSSTISNAAQGYTFLTNTISYTSGRYYTLADSNDQNLATFSFAANVSSSLSLITAKGMTSKGSYNIKYSTTAPTDAATVFHGLYLGSSAKGTNSVTSFTAK